MVHNETHFSCLALSINAISNYGARESCSHKCSITLRTDIFSEPGPQHRFHTLMSRCHSDNLTKYLPGWHNAASTSMIRRFHVFNGQTFWRQKAWGFINLEDRIFHSRWPPENRPCECHKYVPKTCALLQPKYI